MKRIAKEKISLHYPIIPYYLENTEKTMYNNVCTHSDQSHSLLFCFSNPCCLKQKRCLFTRMQTFYFGSCMCAAQKKNEKKRCSWCNMKNPKYIEYHDNEWCFPNFDNHYLYEMLLLESFQAGLSWECVLNKRESFRIAYDNFDLEKICEYDDEKITELLNNKEIIRNKLKINASINNSKIFKTIIEEYGSFYNYLTTFTDDKFIYEIDKTTNELSGAISKDLKKRGMKFVGSTIIYSYLQAIGFIYSHDKHCYLYRNK